MSQQLTVLNLDAPSSVPAYLQAFQSQIGKNIMVGGASRNRLGLKGNRFRIIVGGQEEGVVDDNFLDIVMVGAAEGVSRIYYADGFDPSVKQAPTCYSKKGDEPAADVSNKQSTKCATCPQNEKGSRVADGGAKVRACQFFKRLAVVLPSDPSRVYQLDCKSMSVFGESKPTANKFSMKEYGQKLSTRGIDPSMIVTRLSFDTDSSVPKLLFMPTRYLDEAEAAAIQDVINGEEVKNILEITAQTVDLTAEKDLPEPTPEPTAGVQEPAKTAGPTITRAAPAPQTAAPVAEAPKATAGPTVTRAAPVVTRAAAPVVSRAPAAQAAPVATVAAPAPTVVASSDDDLAALLAELDSE